MKFKQHPRKSPLGDKFKFPVEHPLHFHMGVPSPAFQMFNGKWNDG